MSQWYHLINFILTRIRYLITCIKNSFLKNIDILSFKNCKGISRAKGGGCYFWLKFMKFEQHVVNNLSRFLKNPFFFGAKLHQFGILIYRFIKKIRKCHAIGRVTHEILTGAKGAKYRLLFPVNRSASLIVFCDPWPWISLCIPLGLVSCRHNESFLT